MPNTFYVCLIGVLLPLFSFSGYESGAHMAEETISATKSTPYGILYTCIVSSIAGFIYLVGLLFAMNNNISDILNGQTDEPVINIFEQSFT